MCRPPPDPDLHLDSHRDVPLQGAPHLRVVVELRASRVGPGDLPGGHHQLPAPERLCAQCLQPVRPDCDGHCQGRAGQSRDQNGYGFKLLTGLSVFILFWLFYYPLFVYQPVFGYSTQRASTFLLFMGSSIVNLWKLIPSFLTRPGSLHLANYIWIGSILVFLILFYLKFHKILPSKKRQVFISSSLFLLLTYLFCFYPHVHLIPENRYQDEKICFFNNSRNFRFIPDQQGFNILAGNTYKIFLEHRDQQPSLNLVFANTDQVEVWVTNKTSRLFRSGRQKVDRFSIEWRKLKSIKIKNRTVFPIEIRTRTRARQAFLFLQFM